MAPISVTIYIVDADLATFLEKRFLKKFSLAQQSASVPSTFHLRVIENGVLEGFEHSKIAKISIKVKSYGCHKF